MGSIPPEQVQVVRTPFIEHVHELRRRLLISLVFVVIGAGIGYSISDSLLAFIQQPLGQKLFYTSPTGGFSFVFMLCIFFGIIFALPCIIYQIIAFLKPILPSTSRRSMLIYPLCSVGLTALGIAFAYNISLPASLHFLANFGGGNIEALITTDTYFNFALAYIAGFAILFQLPLLLIITNRITPLKPGKLMKWQRYVIIGSFIVAAMITPTPDPFNQLLMAGPIIILYQFSILFIWIINRSKKKKPVPAPIVYTKKLGSVALLLPSAAPPRLAPAPLPHRLITDIATTKRNLRPSTRHVPESRPLKAGIASRLGNSRSPQWSGGLIDIVR